jgi:hypothetical protein
VEKTSDAVFEQVQPPALESAIFDGMRQFAIRDSNGCLLQFGQEI